jgi:glucokinase
MEEAMYPPYRGKIKLLMSSLKDADAAVLGASALAW